jgi:subtilisin family serine protease
MKRNVTLIISGISLAVASSGAYHPAQATSDHIVQTGKSPNAPLPDQFIVVARSGVPATSIAAAVGTTPKFVYHTVFDGFAAALNPAQVNQLRRDPNVVAVEQDHTFAISPTETTIQSQGQGTAQLTPPWNLDRIDQATGLDGVYKYDHTGAGVHAYVIDTGIKTSQPEFGGRAIDVYDVSDGDGQDCQGHGTHVSGIIGSESYGVAKDVQLRGVKVFPACTSTTATSTIIAGVDWVATHAIHPAVANMSLSGDLSPALNTAVNNLANSGIFVAVAAGNSSGDACTESPASASTVLAVAASDINDTRASFSNFGPCVDLYAPGVNIPSVPLTGIKPLVLSGTSMAAPMVTGVAAHFKQELKDVPTGFLNRVIISGATEGVIKNNPANTPNRLLFKP